MVTKCFVVLLVVVSTVLGSEDVRREPVYKYRYQTDEMMKTSASEVPVRGYHVVEGSYYPEKYRGGFDRFSDGGHGGYFNRGFGYFPGYSNSFGGSPYYEGPVAPRFYHGGPIGGGFVHKNYYNDENKKVEGGGFEKAQGSKAASADHGSEGYSKGQIAHKDEKGDNGFYQDDSGEKKAYDDGRSYHGGQHFNNAGEKGQAEKEKTSHRKGHATKGFKTSHHKDESGKTETFYDEANDEGDNYNYGGNQGSFAANGQSSFKGGHENGEFARDEKHKQGHYDNHRIIDKANANKGQYGERGYQGAGEAYNYNNGIGQHSLLGRQEANREFYHHHPYGHRPFYAGF